MKVRDLTHRRRREVRVACAAAQTGCGRRYKADHAASGALHVDVHAHVTRDEVGTVAQISRDLLERRADRGVALDAALVLAVVQKTTARTENLRRRGTGHDRVEPHMALAACLDAFGVDSRAVV